MDCFIIFVKYFFSFLLTANCQLLTGKSFDFLTILSYNETIAKGWTDSARRRWKNADRIRPAVRFQDEESKHKGPGQTWPFNLGGNTEMGFHNAQLNKVVLLEIRSLHEKWSNSMIAYGSHVPGIVFHVGFFACHNIPISLLLTHTAFRHFDRRDSCCMSPSGFLALC